MGTDIRSNKWDYTIELPLLGHKASHGCVRVNPNVQEDGLNMYWLWTHIPYGVKVLIIDDPEAREQRFVELADSSLSFLPLTYGSKDSHVKNLQNLLKDLDLLKGKPDGVYGALTRDAVMTFQQKEGLPCTGVCDTETWLLIKKRCSAL
ncbi:MAG: peptidoglycan-binding protein [Clostridia bacterium]|nr:peptidoglycan-binding protein [Clostridia bacterium]